MTTPRTFNHTPEVKVIRVFVVTFTRGAGVETDPVRMVIRYFDKAGTLLAEVDPVPPDGGSLIPDSLREVLRT